MDLKNLLELFNHNFTLFVIFPSILCVGLYLTLKLSFVQCMKLKKSFVYLTEKSTKQEGEISRFEAIASVLAGNFGTGNISGMAVAITTGGPGALVWMWIMVFFAAAIQYASCVLGVSYRTKTQNNEHVGGPMYYLQRGLGFKKCAFLFALFTLFGAVTVGNFAQINSIILPLETMGLNPLACSLVLAFFVALVILGGVKRIAHFASLIVPVKALIYLGTALVIICLNYERVLPAFQLMFQDAFSFTSVAGGALGSFTFKAITTGFDRGLFATDAGTGIVPILQASARSKHPVVDGIATLIAPLMVMIVCTATGLVLIITGAWQSGLQSTNMVTFAFAQGLGSEIGSYIVMVSLLLFAYTTILAWGYCGEKALEFLVGSKKAVWFKRFYILLVPVGTLIHLDMIWTLADIAITLMLMMNLIGVIGLRRRVVDLGLEFNATLRGNV